MSYTPALDALRREIMDYVAEYGDIQQPVGPEDYAEYIDHVAARHRAQPRDVSNCGGFFALPTATLKKFTIGDSWTDPVEGVRLDKAGCYCGQYVSVSVVLSHSVNQIIEAIILRETL